MHELRFCKWGSSSISIWVGNYFTYDRHSVDLEDLSLLVTRMLASEQDNRKQFWSCPWNRKKLLVFGNDVRPIRKIRTKGRTRNMRTNERTVGRTNGQTDKRTDGRTKGWRTKGQANKWKDWRTDEILLQYNHISCQSSLSLSLSVF